MIKASRNRLANTHNQYQGSFRRVLCVCSAGLLRSPTLAFVLSNPPYNCNVRAAGIDPDFALVPVDQALLEWAQHIFCMNKDQKRQIESWLKFDGATYEKPVVALDIPDNYGFRDPELVLIMQNTLKHINFPEDNAPQPA